MGAQAANDLGNRYGKWLMCEPRFFEVTYEINPWMSKDSQVDQVQALKQWRFLKQTIQDCGGDVVTIDHINGLPDMVFTANGALVSGVRAVIPHFFHEQRKSESRHFKSWFIENGYRVMSPDLVFEGAGDGLFAGETLLFGYGQRTEKDVLPSVAEFLEVDDWIGLELVDSRFYHLDTCLCPLAHDTLLLYPNAFSTNSLENLQERFTLVEISESDACSFACNSVVLDKKIITPDAATGAIEKMRTLGFEVYPVALGEFIKAGGAAKCLSLQIE